MESLWRHFGNTLGSLWDHFGVTFGSRWDHFGVTLGSLWDHFGITLVSLWGHFGVTLGPWNLVLYAPLDPPSPRAELDGAKKKSRPAPRGSRAWTFLSGIFVSSGFFLYFTGTPVVSRAVGVVFACSSSVVNIICGALVFNEYRHASTVKKLQGTGAVACFALSISLVCKNKKNCTRIDCLSPGLGVRVGNVILE